MLWNKVKNLLSAVLTFGTFSSVQAQDSTLNVLFIGNSYTHMNSLPGTIATAAASVTGGKFTLNYDQSTPGGYYWYRHAADTNTMKKIKAGNWNAVVLQEQSQMLSLSDSTIASESLPYLQILVDTIRKYNPGVQLYFYRTWGRKFGDKQNGLFWHAVNTYEGMDSLLSLRYHALAESMQGKVVPVGDIWKSIRKKHPDIELYAPDESHPSPRGTYAAAVTFLHAFFGVNPMDITYDGKLPAKEALLIRKTAEEVLLPNNASSKGARVKKKAVKPVRISNIPEVYLGDLYAKPRLKKEDFPFGNHNGTNGPQISAAVVTSSGSGNPRRKRSKEN